MGFLIHVFIHLQVLFWSADHWEAPGTLSSLCFPLSWMHPSWGFPVLGQEAEHSWVRKLRTLWGIPHIATFIQHKGLSFSLRFSLYLVIKRPISFVE